MIKSLLIFFFAWATANAQNNYTQYVNPMIGTGGHGHTFPGATMPFAMVQLSPDTRIDGSWDGCSGYHYSDTFIYGFSHTHLSGTGCSDYGDIAFLPTLVDKPVQPIWNIDTLYAHFSHKTEVAKAGYYSVELNGGRIKVELTSTTRVGLQKYTYKKSGYTWITLNLKHRDQLLEGKITEISKRKFSGLRRSKAWAEDQLLYYYFELSRDAENVRISRDKNGDTKVNLGFWVKAGESIMVKTALSSVDENGAKGNMEKELPHWDFEKVRKGADAAWNKELNRIKVYGGTETEKINFYTAMYHCMIHPNVMNDADGRYRGRDKQVHKAEGFDYYTVFSLWDTHRALHPLLNLIDKKRSHDFIMTFKAQYEQSGRLPMWELWGNETNCMIGFHSVSVILDAYVKGVISLEELNDIYPAVRAEAMSNRFGLDKFREKGYLEVEDESESVSKTLEYSYDMWCAAQIADAIGDWNGCQDALHMMDDAYLFNEYSRGWPNIYDIKTGFVRPRKNGGWLEPFDPRQVNNHFTEANSWQYSFFTPHENLRYPDLLDSLFKADSRTTGREQSDITGLIGQYAHGNEPSHSFIYLLPFDKRIPYLERVMDGLYKNAPDGLCGNEDCGQMSAWYVFSAMGFYPVCPGSNSYSKGISLFDSISINKQSLRKLNLNFSETPSIRPYVAHSLPYNSAPLIYSSKSVFADYLLIKIQKNSLDTSTNWHGNLYLGYSVDDTIYKQYMGPFYINANSVIKAAICQYNFGRSWENNEVITIDWLEQVGNISTAHFYKRPNNYSITLNSTYNKQYTADGDEGLIDGLLGDADWRKGRWQGYQGQDFECVIDLRKVMPVNSIQAGFLQDTRAWILFPKSVTFYGSVDGVNFEEISTIQNEVADTSMNSQRVWLGKDNIRKSYRFIKVKGINYGKLPSWHPGAGGDAFIFIDEIKID